MPDCLDLTGVGFLSSMVFAKFITLEKSKYLLVINVRLEIYELFEMKRLDRLFYIYQKTMGHPTLKTSIRNLELVRV